MRGHLTLIDGGNERAASRNAVARCLRIQRRLGAFFEGARIKSGLSCAELDQQIGLKRGTYATWEAGFQIPPSDMLSEILSHFDDETNCEFQELFTKIQQQAAALRGMIWA